MLYHFEGWLTDGPNKGWRLIVRPLTSISQSISRLPGPIKDNGNIIPEFDPVHNSLFASSHRQDTSFSEPTAPRNRYLDMKGPPATIPTMDLFLTT